jgi:hypothetical protein
MTLNHKYKIRWKINNNCNTNKDDNFNYLGCDIPYKYGKYLVTGLHVTGVKNGI